MRLLLLPLTFLLPLLAPAQNTGARVVSGAVLLNSQTMPKPKALLDELRSNWKITTDSVNISDKTIVFSTPEGTVMLAYLDYPVAQNEVYTAAAISWLWKSAETEATRHQAQLVVSVLGTAKSNPLKLYQLFTRVAAAALSVSDAAGVYMNEELLLLSKGYYLEAAKNMSDDNLPLYCWIYFGLMEEEGGKSGVFTYGLKEFGFLEMEIIQSKHSLQEAHAVLYDAAEYVLKYNIRLKDGQQVPLDEGLKLPVSYSKAVYIEEGETIKLAY